MFMRLEGFSRTFVHEISKNFIKTFGNHGKDQKI